MDLLTPRVLPFIFLGVALLFLVSYLRHLGDPGQRLSQRTRLRLMLIFTVVGAILLILRARTSLP